MYRGIKWDRWIIFSDFNFYLPSKICDRTVTKRLVVLTICIFRFFYINCLVNQKLKNKEEKSSQLFYLIINQYLVQKNFRNSIVNEGFLGKFHNRLR